MEEQLRHTEIPYTHIPNKFTVFFYGDRVYIGKRNYPIGQCGVDVMNMDGAVIGEIVRRAADFGEAAHALLEEDTNAAAQLAQEKLNAVWDVVFSLPVYRDLLMDRDYTHRLIELLLADREKWAQVRTPGSSAAAQYERMILELLRFPQYLAAFRQQLSIMTERYFEPLKRRGSCAYADAYAEFYTDMLRVAAAIPGEDFDQSFPVQVSFVPMQHETDEEGIFIAEKTTFGSLVDFLRVEFYRGLAAGNAPRRCHNCGKYFLLTKGYNTCYCGNLAPGETDRTCRKVGAHRKEARGKAGRSPARVEYDRAYNRQKQQKNRKKISVDEWNAAVAEAMAVLEQAERGELSDDEMRARFREF